MTIETADHSEDSRVEPGAGRSRKRADEPRASYLDVKGLADLLGVADCFVRRLVWERRIPYYKFGKYVRFDVAEVLEHLAQQRVDPLR